MILAFISVLMLSCAQRQYKLLQCFCPKLGIHVEFSPFLFGSVLLPCKMTRWFHWYSKLINSNLRITRSTSGTMDQETSTSILPKLDVTP